MTNTILSPLKRNAMDRTVVLTSNPDLIICPFEQMKQAAALRDLLRPAPVRLGHVPQWLHARMLVVFGRSPLDALLVVSPGSLNESRWLDHWGSIDNGAAFVAEPYPSLAAIAGATAFARAVGVRLEVSPASWHCPGHTIRLLFMPPMDGNGQRASITATKPEAPRNARHPAAVPASPTPDLVGRSAGRARANRTPLLRIGRAETSIGRVAFRGGGSFGGKISRVLPEGGAEGFPPPASELQIHINCDFGTN